MLCRNGQDSNLVRNLIDYIIVGEQIVNLVDPVRPVFMLNNILVPNM
jgi:hypothetical protein